ncbi:cobalt-precorrin-6A reductase [Clostridium rectalis]|uniref:cobalt-precorrin-6A reductase n=1 Tax=Clostridium rectalis TaxID=2040295 RepID=UPI000F632C1C|nr:cobalt-precorrin-6A reductase [Clostridium rectalis]
MIGLISGTSDGREILSMLNKYTDNILISTATEYGGELLKKYNYKILNTKPLLPRDMEKLFKQNNIKILIDSSHPYAIEVSKNAMNICKKLGIEYVRYERESVVNRFLNEEKIIEVDTYEELYKYLVNIDGTVINTTGSRNLGKILNLNLNNRIVHRVLPSMKVIEECYLLGIQLDDLIAIKGPISYELNKAFIKEFNANAILIKDSGVEGGTEEKIKAALDENIFVFVVGREKLYYNKVFYNKEKLIDYVKNRILKEF